jgi:hypothetical protein
VKSWSRHKASSTYWQIEVPFLPSTLFSGKPAARSPGVLMTYEEQMVDHTLSSGFSKTGCGIQEEAVTELLDILYPLLCPPHGEGEHRWHLLTIYTPTSLNGAKDRRAGWVGSKCYKSKEEIARSLPSCHPA